MTLFKIGSKVKFPSCHSDMHIKCKDCESCTANAYELVHERERTCDEMMVHGIVVGHSKITNRRGIRYEVQIRANNSKHIDRCVFVSSCMLRPYKGDLPFKMRSDVGEDVEDGEIFNPLSII